MSAKIQDIDDKIEKLWELLEGHNKALESLIARSKKAISNKLCVSAGELAGEIVVITQADVCYTIAIEILEGLKKRKT